MRNGSVSIVAVACAILLLGCADERRSQEKAAIVKASSSQNLQLTTKHKSVFNKISYRIPSGWIVIDGESDWIAPSEDKLHGQPTFDSELDAYYAVSVIFPYLTMDDMGAKRVRSFEELVGSTLHSLKIASGATGQETPEFITVNDYDAAAINVELKNGSAFHQVFIKLSNDEIASVAGGGPLSQSLEIQSLVRAIAATVESGKK